MRPETTEKLDLAVDADLPLRSLSGILDFDCAARLESFVRAAETLHKTPAAVSLQIRQLEASLGFPLFARHPRRVVLTERGRAFAETVARALRSLPALMAARHFGINLLECGQEEISARFARAQSRKWDGIGQAQGEKLDCPLIPGTLAHFECLPHATFEGGDHIIFLVRVVGFAIDEARRPLVFFRSRYHRLETPTESQEA